MKARPRVAVVHCGFGWVGGAEAVAAWTLQALKKACSLTLITVSPFSSTAVNTFYGTQLEASDVSVRYLPLPARLQQDGAFWYLKHHLAMRYCKAIKREFDLFVSTYFEKDFGKRGIQYVHSPAFALMAVSASIRSRPSLRRLYQAFSHMCSGFSLDAVRQNVTLVNSYWTGRRLAELYGVPAQVVYPPVLGVFPQIAWAEREEGFVSVGRIARDKRLEDVVHIVEGVRERGLDVHLHVVGDPVDRLYYNEIMRLREDRSSWLLIEGQIPRWKLADLLSRHKYGIHGKTEEHFGIAVAEMVQAGCIVFVPHGGGQIEIVDTDYLTYRSLSEAVEKIIAVMKSEALQEELRGHLAARQTLFSVERFCATMRDLVLGELGA